MPRSSWPSSEWFQYHLETREWHKATKDLWALYDGEFISAAQFYVDWQRLGNTMLETKS